MNMTDVDDVSLNFVNALFGEISYDHHEQFAQALSVLESMLHSLFASVQHVCEHQQNAHRLTAV